MEYFINPQTVEKSKEKTHRYRLLFWAMVAAAVALLVVLCCMTRTGNARYMLVIAIISMILVGWGVLAFRIFAVEPARANSTHLEGLEKAKAGEAEGILTMDPEAFRIPKSVRVLKVYLETEGESISLNLNEKLRSAMPPDGSWVRVQTAGKFITGIEILEKAEEKQPRPVPSAWRAFRRGAAKFIPAAVVWTLLAVILTGFVFNRITDTDPAHKITIYADCEILNAAGLAEKLEKGMEDPIRMVKVHPFKYAMLGTEQLKTADLYIVPDSRRADYAEWIGEEYRTAADPESGLAAAGAYFQYYSGEPEATVYRLYLGTGSVHLEDGLARQAADMLLSIENEKGETK